MRVELLHPRTYHGSRLANGRAQVTVEWDNPERTRGVRRLNERHELYNHSPDGFEWGYVGSGPAQLALAILADLLNVPKGPLPTDRPAVDVDIVMRYYQDFKFQVIAALPRENWILEESSILDWLCSAVAGRGELESTILRRSQ